MTRLKIEHIIIGAAIIVYTLLLAILTSAIFIIIDYEKLINTPKYYIVLAILWIGIIGLNVKKNGE